MDQKKDQIASTDKKKQEESKRKGLGKILRQKREELGFTYEQISETIKLRPFILKALENGDWDNLPSPVFIKGFIRSYATALNLKEENLDEYHLEIGTVDAILSEPFMDQTETRKRIPFLLIFCLVSIAVVFLLWKVFEKKNISSINPTTDQSELESSILPTEDLPPKVSLDKTISLPLDEKTETIPDYEDAKDKDSHPVSYIEEQQSIGQEEKITDDLSELNNIKEPTLIEKKYMPIDDNKPLILKANIIKKTWVKIYVDDHRAKEYIFLPGSTPEWNADNGFEILVGNAAGLNLEFNNKKIDNLGGEGKVVRLKLPKTYKRGSF